MDLRVRNTAYQLLVVESLGYRELDLAGFKVRVFSGVCYSVEDGNQFVLRIPLILPI